MRGAVASLMIFLLVSGCAGVVPPHAPSCEDLSFHVQGSVPNAYLTYLTLLGSQSIVRDEAAEMYLNKIMAKIWSAAGGHGDPPPVFLVPDAVYNAQATPDKSIFVGWQVLRDASSEAEIAGILAHEAAHITLQHYETHAWLTQLRRLSVVASMVVPMAAGGTAILGSAAGIWVGQIPLRFAHNVWSRPQESEADLRAVDTLVHAGYLETGVNDFLEKLSREEKNEGGSDTVTAVRQDGTAAKVDGKKIALDTLAALAGMVVESPDTKPYTDKAMHDTQERVRKWAVETHPETEVRRAAVEHYRHEKYPNIPLMAVQDELEAWKQSHADLLDAMEHLNIAWQHIRAAESNNSQASVHLRYAETELGIIFPDTFTTASKSLVVSPPRKRRKRDVPLDDSLQPERARNVEALRQSYSANLAARELLMKRGDSLKAEEYARQLLEREETPLAFFLIIATDELRRKNYELALTYLLEARNRFGEQDYLVPFFLWAYRGLLKQNRENDYSSALKASCYDIKCATLPDLSQSCTQVGKKIP